VCVDPTDVVAFLALYPNDVTDLWEEPGVLSKVGVGEVHDVLNPYCARTVPEVWQAALQHWAQSSRVGEHVSQHHRR
jgi:hypothetical protein